ncbi:DedA family protein [Minicystis rosea]|nr:DedA family protein [Minicystis rosea]
MDHAWLLEQLQHHGDAAIFVAVWLGIWVVPIPDEAVVMSVGLASARGVVGAVPAFALTYLAMSSALSLSYLAGRVVGAPIVDRLAARPRLRRPLRRAVDIVAKFGSAAVAIGYLFPVVRVIVPQLVGAGRMPLARFALCTYGAGLVWTLAYFFAGRTMGEHAGDILELSSRFTVAAVAVGAALCLRLALSAIRSWAATRRGT